MRDALLHDLRFAARALARSPLTTAVAVVTLALGVGANTAVFSVFESILLNPLPYAHADRLVSVANPEANRVRGVSARVAREWQERTGAVDAIGQYTDSQLVFTGDGDPDVFRGQRVNAEFFDTLGVRPLLGRLFSQDDDRPRAAAVVVLSYELWSTRFGGDAAVVGRVLTLNGTPHRVIGVLDRTFQPLRMSNPAEEPRIYAPLGCDRIKGCGAPGTIGRLAQGVSVAQAREALTTTLRRLHE